MTKRLTRMAAVLRSAKKMKGRGVKSSWPFAGVTARQSRGSATTGRSGERRSARLKWRSLWRDEKERDETGMLDDFRNEQHRQLGRLRQERRRREMDYRTNRAIIVRLIGRMLCGRGRRGEHVSSRRRSRMLFRPRTPSRWTWPNDNTSCTANANSASREPSRLSVLNHRIKKTHTRCIRDRLQLTPGRRSHKGKIVSPVRQSSVLECGVSAGTQSTYCGIVDMILPSSRRACVRAAPRWDRSPRAGRISPAWP